MMTPLPVYDYDGPVCKHLLFMSKRSSKFILIVCLAVVSLNIQIRRAEHLASRLIEQNYEFTRDIVKSKVFAV